MSGAPPDLVWPVLGLGVGAIIGSFLATALIRWPRGESVVAGRSRCDRCGARLSPLELVPILSYALAGGRCRHCARAIDPRHPMVELAAAAVGGASFVAHPLPLAFVTGALGLWLLLLAMLDLEHQWLPDRLTLPLVPFGLAAAWAGFGPPLFGRLLGAMIGWSGLYLLAAAYRRVRGREGMGGGDPRLLAGIGAWVGLFSLPFILLGAGLLGLAAVLLMLARGEEVSGTSRLPLGALMAVAAWPIWLVIAG